MGFIALLGISIEIKGLFLKNGISSFQEIYKNFQEHGINEFFKLPSFFVFNAQDYFIYLILIIAFACLIVLASHFFRNRYIRSGFFLIFYLCYLSFVNFGEPFMSFQWDALLLEASFLFFIYFFFSQDLELARLNIWLFRLLVFKLMFMSGLVKLLSGDLVWQDFSALKYHYFTQPLPSLSSFFVHQLPALFHKSACLLMFVIELIFPFFIFFGKKFRELAAWSFIVLQVIIFCTGNYGFFNLLTIVLCFSLFDFKSGLDQKYILHRTYKYFSWTILVLYTLVSLSLICSRIKMPEILLQPAKIYYKTLGRFHACNPYGLFAMMTKKRGEIVIQAGRQIPGELGVEWQDYKFKYKPQDLKRLPSQIAPLQPRLDWQMWFAALSDYRRNPWFLKLAEKLLYAEKDVLDLFANKPFNGQKPDFIRALYFDYSFNDFQSYLKTKDVWQRDYQGVYLKQVSLSKSSR